MKTLKLFVSVILCTATFAACSGNQSKNTETSVNTVEIQKTEVDDILSNGAQYAGKEVAIEGICSHRCKHGGGKMFVMGNDNSNIIRIESSETSGKFPTEVTNALVQVKGTVAEERIDEAYLQNWESKLGEETKQHGESEAGCSTEKAARKESAKTNSPKQRT
ncbi:MAG: hypothetical protein ACRCZQ_03650, partial [Bacteroidales bacterium]